MRRPPGEVRDAILKFMGNRQDAVEVSTIYAGVREQLGDVPPSSVRSYLRLNSKAADAPFLQVGRGKYRLKHARKSE